SRPCSARRARSHAVACSSHSGCTQISVGSVGTTVTPGAYSPTLRFRHTRGTDTFDHARYVGGMAKTSATPWGVATVVDEVSVQQRAGDKRFASVVQLLEADGERLVRFSYATGGVSRRGPVTLRAR